MKTKSIFVVLLLFSVSVLAQPKFLPIIDTSLICSYNEGYWVYSLPDEHGYMKKELEIFFVVENMPRPKIPVSEIESMLEKRVSLNTQEMNYNGNIYLQCIINCKGKAGDFQINDCPSEFFNVGCQLLNLFRESIDNWEPPKQRGHDVDLLTRVKVTINQGHFKVVAPCY